ncbi:helix-turn-helix transcriptional regulator [Liquorilactobacillus mali]|nr:hypothetical protein [Liquorilactobacillus mali]
MIEKHIETKHDGSLLALLKSPQIALGFSGSQKRVLVLFAQGLKDKVIAKWLNLATSTIRNYRFKLKEKKQQALQLIATLDPLDLNSSIIQPRIGTKMLDDRYAITVENREKVLKNYLDINGRIKTWPNKEKIK